jgi:hypothetical protein
MCLLDYRAWIFVLLFSTLVQPAYASCKLTEKEIVGEWQTVDDDGFFGEFEITSNHRFNSWLHQRPELVDATWKFNDCNLIIMDNTQPNFVYQVKLVGLQLVLIEHINGTDFSTRYQKIKH